MSDLKRSFHEVYETLSLNCNFHRNNLDIAVGTQNVKLGYKLDRNGGRNFLGSRPNPNYSHANQNFTHINQNYPRPDLNYSGPNINIVDYNNHFPVDNFSNMNTPQSNYQNFNNLNIPVMGYQSQMYSPNYSNQYANSYPDNYVYNQNQNYWDR